MIGSNAKVHIGNRVFFNNYCSVVSLDDIYIGDDCIFGENVKIYDHNHRFDVKDKRKAEQGFKTDAVIIKDNCWIANNVVILKGVTIGRGCNVAAGAVVNKSTPPYSIVGGVPAKVLKMRFTPEQIKIHEDLLRHK